MKTIAQALTFKDIAVIRGALLDDIARTDLPTDTEPMKEALKKADRTYHQRPREIHFIVISAEPEEITEEQ